MHARLLIDAWFSAASLILPLLAQQVRIIGRWRRDTALYLPPAAGAKAPGTETQVWARASMRRCSLRCRSEKWN